jgi:hypothetical protein
LKLSSPIDIDEDDSEELLELETDRLALDSDDLERLVDSDDSDDLETDVLDCD